MSFCEFLRNCMVNFTFDYTLTPCKIGPKKQLSTTLKNRFSCPFTPNFKSTQNLVIHISRRGNISISYSFMFYLHSPYTLKIINWPRNMPFFLISLVYLVQVYKNASNFCRQQQQQSPIIMILTASNTSLIKYSRN